MLDWQVGSCVDWYHRMMTVGSSDARWSPDDVLSARFMIGVFFS